LKELFSISQVTVFLWILLAVFVIFFIIERIDTVFHYLRPYKIPSRTEEWLRQLESTASGGNSESMMRELAKKQILRKRRHSSILRNARRRIYLNLQSVRRQLKRTPANTISTIPASLWIFDNYNLLYREIKKLQGTGKRNELSRRKFGRSARL